MKIQTTHSSYKFIKTASGGVRVRVLHHEPTLSVLLALQYNVSKQRCFVWLSHTHVESGLR